MNKICHNILVWLLFAILILLFPLAISDILSETYNNLPDVPQEKLSLYFDLIKFILGTFALGLIATRINAQIQNRQISLREQEHLSKFTEEALQDNTARRLRMAQYFTAVTQSNELRDGWARYLNLIEQEHSALTKKKEVIEERVSQVEERLKKIDPRHEQYIQEIESLKQQYEKLNFLNEELATQETRKATAILLKPNTDNSHRELLNIHINEANISGSNFTRSSLKNILFNKTNVIASNFNESFIGRSKFYSCDFTHADFEDSSFFDARFESCSLNNAIFTEANITYVKFVACNLENSLFINSFINGCTFTGSILKDVCFDGCFIDDVDFSSARELNTKQFDKAILTKNNRFDAAFEEKLKTKSRFEAPPGVRNIMPILRQMRRTTNG